MKAIADILIGVVVRELATAQAGKEKTRPGDTGRAIDLEQDNDTPTPILKHSNTNL